MKKLLAFSICICLLFVTIGVLPVHGEEDIYDSVLRLHVVANSDSEEDQSLKLEVRDKVIQISRELCGECQRLEEAQAIIKENLQSICDTAAEQIKESGYNYSVEVRLGEEKYPRKTYDSLCFPSGKYLSLQVLIGNAEGQNWWCVLFPPLCLDAATDPSSNEELFISVGLTSEQYKIITESDSPSYKARFKLLEIIENAIQ